MKVILADCVGSHTENVAAGAEMLRAATFCSDCAESVARAVSELVAVARGTDIVAASFGPCDLHVDYYGAARDAGAQIVIAETMTSVSGAGRAVALARQAGLPVIVSAALSCDGTLVSGETLESFGSAVVGLDGVVGVGLNCGVSPDSFEPYVGVLAGHAASGGIALYLSPSAGVPDGHGRYPFAPERFASVLGHMLATARECGVQTAIVAGCCGTTPCHTAALAAILSSGYNNVFS